MAKPRKSELENPEAVHADNGHYMGLGYFIPEGYNAREVQELFEKWNKKLQDSGHIDIEHYSGFRVGRVSPRLKQGSVLNQNNTGALFTVGLVDTYMSNYFETCTPPTLKLRKFYTTDVLLLKAFSAGVDLGSLTRLFKEPTTTSIRHFFEKYNIIGTQHSIVHKNKGRSKFWLYTRTKTALAHCYAWHMNNVNGELTEELLNIYQLPGIDSKKTEKIINEARTKAGLAPIKLKWDKKNY